MDRGKILEKISELEKEQEELTPRWKDACLNMGSIEGPSLFDIDVLGKYNYRQGYINALKYVIEN